MIESGSYSGRSTASLRWSGRYSTLRIAADGMSATTAARTAVAVESTATMGTVPTSAGVGMTTTVRTAPVESTATMGTVPTSAGVGVTATVRTAAVMLSERRVGAR